MSEQIPPPILVADSAALSHCVEALHKSDVLAVDTEFMRTDTFYPILGLIQIFDGQQCWLIDPVALESLDALGSIFKNPAIIKVFHSCSEDLEVLQHVMGTLPQPLFDTQIAAALTGFGFSRGYAALVDDMLGHHVPKGETRSDWLQRPLSEAQLGYAASDVYFLLPVYHLLVEALKKLDRTVWMDEEMATLVGRSLQTDDTADYYRKVKGAWKLEAKALQVLQAICQWREVEARQRNRPRNRLIADRTLLDIAIAQPANKQSLAGIEGIFPGFLRRYGEDLLSLIHRVQSDHVSNPKPLPPLDAPLPKVARDMAKELKAVASECAESRNLSVEMLVRKRDIEELVRSAVDTGKPRLSAALREGWRYELIGQMLLAEVSRLLSSRPSTVNE
ncbi:ribonuclease D [uncultured Porticoccus sp.]|uniref:ribonuclease D n=1 Tax=uncultured Porticoccus sp. TaxID=1256050 RepID=UPI0030DC1D38|tara:strand:+ start:3000 stop:4172 length:1173 start_codon:yes stop_codon:yes gene_type:complete